MKFIYIDLFCTISINNLILEPFEAPECGANEVWHQPNKTDQCSLGCMAGELRVYNIS
jgi:hypothetical protein